MFTSKKLSWLGLIVVSAVLLTACGSGASQAQQPVATQPSGDSGPAQNPGSLANTSWKLTEVDGKAIPSDVGATVAFTGDQVTGSGGCNGFGGGYKVEGSTITFSEIVSTLMACEGPKMDVETSFMSVLQDKATFVQSSDSLVITGSNGTKLSFAPK